MTDKQYKFINYLVDKLGYRNSPRRREFLSKILEKVDEIDGVTSASKLIERLLEENKLRTERILKKFHTNHLSVTDLAAYEFCPASYAIKETYETQETERMEQGKELHGKKFLKSFLNNLRNKREGQIRQFQIEGEKIEEYLYRGSYGDLLKSELIFVGHELEKPEPFFSENGNLTGIPDYIFQQLNNGKFVVEEKHTWRQDDISAPFSNHIIQILGYIYGLKSLQLSYGYVIYFHWGWFKGSLSSTKVNIFKITKSISSKSHLVEIYNTVRSLKRGISINFETNKLNTKKCVGCSVRVFCNHKSGRYKVLRIPYENV